MDKTKEYKVFISYCWTTFEHEEWVVNLATRLMENGVEVKLDKWDLKPGQDKYVFMESMVQDTSIDRVLIICDEGYKQKSDNREGGVGTETQIITPEIYSKTSQEKFIPIIAQKGEKFDSYMPNYLKSRIAIDLSSEEIFEDNYDKLLRLIAEIPLYKRPAKGQLPSYLFSDEKPHFKTHNLVKQFKNYLVKKPEQASYILADFIDEFKNSFDIFQLTHEDMKEPYDEVIYSKINEMLPLRNDYLDFFSSLCKSKLFVDIDVIINLFEDIYAHTEFQHNGSNIDLQFDHFKFFINEIFLYTAVLLIENKMYEKLNLLLSSKYFVKSRKDYKSDGVFFTEFWFPIPSLNKLRKSRLNSNKISITADTLIQRSTFNNKNYKEQLWDVDLLLHYISVIRFDKNDSVYWFPITYIYFQYKKIDLLKRLVSRRHFDKVKILFNVETEEEMKLALKKYEGPYTGHEPSHFRIPTIVKHINPEEVCSSV